MNQKITPDHLGRGAVVYVRQSTMGQVVENTESGRRQYALAESARTMGFASVAIIDDDLGRSGSGTIERLGFQKLVASVCAGSIGAIFCIEASRLARNGRDWRLIDLCALVGALVIDPDGTYDPRLVNDRLLLGLKGRMSEYEISSARPPRADFLSVRLCMWVFSDINRCTMRPCHAGILWYERCSSPPLSLPWRRQSCRQLALHWDWRPANR